MVPVRALVFGNRNDDDLGVVGDWAAANRFTFDRRLREDQTGSIELSRYDLVISLGSEWSVYWPRVGDQLRIELDVLRQAVDLAVPVLGVCFGGQMLSTALGGEVTRAPKPEFGWIAIETDHPDLVPAGPWMEWHIDRFTVPPGAVEIARTDSSSQAFAVGRALGLQFHPEVDAAIVKRWVSDGDEELRAQQIRPADVIAGTEENEVRARRDTFAMLDAFWATVATG